jgi:hypothetical protein
MSSRGRRVLLVRKKDSLRLSLTILPPSFAFCRLEKSQSMSSRRFDRAASSSVVATAKLGGSAAERDDAPNGVVSEQQRSMQRRSNSERQSTLFGLWHRSENKRSRDPSPHKSTSQSIAPRLRPPRRSKHEWENISLPNGPMLLLRSCIGGSDWSERRSTMEALASLPDWKCDVKFKIYGRECQMRRRICQYSSGGNVSYTYSGLVRYSA